MRTRGSLASVFLLLVSIEAFSQQNEFFSPAQTFDKAKALSDTGNFTGSIAVLRQIDARDTAYEAARYRIIHAFIGNGQPDSALRLIDQGLRKPASLRPDYLRLKGIAMATVDVNKAVEILEAALKEYPANVLLRYSLAAVQFDHKRYEKAAAECFRILDFSPFYSNAHKLLSRMAILQGHKVHAMMSMGIYLGTNPGDNQALVMLNQLVDNQVSDEGSYASFSVNDASRLDQMIHAKIAMASSFKSAFSFSAPVVRQFELLFDQINTLPRESGDEYLNRYLGVYHAIKSANEMEPFIYFILTSANIDAAKKWRGKNEKTLIQFYKTVNTALMGSRTKLALAEFGLPEKTSMWYDDNHRVSSAGNMQNEKRTGPWIFLHTNAQKMAVGSYSDGVKRGVWNYYFDSGVLKSSENMDTGEVTVYSPEGKKAEHFFLKSDKIDGDAEIFFTSGARSKLMTYVAGERHGKTTEYYATGVVKEVYSYDHGKIAGPYEWFHPNGRVRIKTTFNDNYYNGRFEEFHTNGMPKSTGEYSAGVAIGPWKFYYSNGKVRSEGKYSGKGKRVGEWSFYDHLGALTSKDRYDDEGRLEGISATFEEGKQRLQWEYKKDLLIKHTSFDQNGKVIFTAANSNGTFYIKVYDVDGTLQREGNYLQGKANGVWKYYNRYGTLTRECSYKGGDLHGLATDYYWTGKRQSQVNYEEGERHGKYSYNFSHGGLMQEGWYASGNAEQRWLNYYTDGTLESDSYYIQDELAGRTQYFAVDGKPHMEVTYQGEIVEDELTYDSKGNVASVKRVDGTRDIYEQFYSNKKLKHRSVAMAGNYVDHRVAYYPDGQLYYEYEFLMNKRHGMYVYHHPGGKISVKGIYEDGERTGIWERYREDGTMSSAGRYFEGRDDSVWTFYHDNGNISSRGMRRDGQRHGVVTYHNPDGKVVLEKEYRFDELVAYRSMTGGTPGEWIKFTGNGKIELTYPDGKPAWSQEYRNGLLHGAHREYYSNGNVFEETLYVDGEREGDTRTFYANGKLKTKEPYKHDELHGVQEAYDENGKKTYSAQYRYGYLHGKVLVLENGKEVKNYNFWHGAAEQ